MQIQQLDDSRVQILNQQMNSLGNNIQEINNIFENHFQRQVPPLIDIPENVGNQDLIAYAKCQYCLGECCGCFRTWIPCVFCFCVSYPYKEIDQGTQGLFSRFGRYSSTVKPGLIFVNPCTDSLQTVDMRISVLDLDRQVIMTRDNVTISIDTSVYFKITNPRFALFRVKDRQQCVVQVTYSILKNTVGNFLFQDLLVKRQEIAQEMEQQVEKYVENWGVTIVHIYIKDIQLSVDLQVALSSAATAQRAAMAKIISAKADVESAKLIRQSAEFINSNAAMQTRYLETLQALGTQTTSRVVFIPQEQDKNKVNHYITQGLLS